MSIAIPAIPKLGVLMNRQSGRNRSSTALVEALLAQRPDIPVQRTETAQAVPAALAQLAQQGVNVLAVNGGDGSLQLSLNLLLGEASPFAQAPLLAILPGGTTNMIAHDVGAHRKPAEELKRLLARLDAGTLVQSVLSRPAMRLSGGDIAGVTHGFFFGAAGVYEGTMANRTSIDAIGGRDGAGPAWRLLAIASALMLGRDPVTPVPMRLDLDNQPGVERPYLAVIGTTLQRLSFGMYPFWGGDPGTMRLTTIDQGARRLVRLAPSLLRGRAHPSLNTENGYRSTGANQLALSFAGGFVLDGEIFHATPERPITVQASRQVAFVRG